MIEVGLEPREAITMNQQGTSSSGVRQRDLFEHVLDTFAHAEGALSTTSIYARVGERANLAQEDIEARSPIGKRGARHSTVKRAIRWRLQDLKAMGMIERVAGERGVWQLADTSARKGLFEAPKHVRLVAFSTRLGVAVWGCCETVLAGLDCPISIVVTSPPYPLSQPRRYGGPSDEDEYVDFITRAMEPVAKHLAPGGAVCLNLSNDVFLPGLPARSMYRERLMLELRSRFGWVLADTLLWSNPGKPPGPVMWSSRTRQLLNTGYETIHVLTNDAKRFCGDNRRVLEQHTRRQMQLIERGGEARTTN